MALLRVIEICRRHGIEVVLPADESGKYEELSGDGVSVLASLDGSGAEVCVALGGDGTILRAFNHFNDRQTPVFGINYGRVGFLSAIEPESLDSGIEALLEGRYELFKLSLIELTLHGEAILAFNDVVVHKPDGGSIIRLGYSIGEVAMNSMSCDGMIVATAAGSTAYNLAAGGPLVSLKLDAMTVTAIAPHTLCSRPLVAGPGDVLTLHNESAGAVAPVYVDGRGSGDLAPGDSITLTLSGRQASLAQLEGANFYLKLRDKFIRPWH